MTIEQKNTRTQRVRQLNAVLKTLYPQPTIALIYRTHWELLVAVQLSAQCTDERVNQVTKVLFKEYSTIQAYADAPRIDIERIIYPCGFYHSKAKHIQESARMIIDVYGGVVPHTMSTLTTLPGVARKTANVVLANGFGIIEGIAVDTHVRRFALRFDLTDYTDPIHIERDLMEIMPRSEWWGFNHRLVHYGRDVCPARKHMCTQHPLTQVYKEAQHIWPKAHS